MATKKTGLREVLGTIIANLQKIVGILSKPSQLLPSAKDLQAYLQSNFTPREVEEIGGVLQRAVDEGVVTGNIWMTMIHNLRRSVDRDMLTRDARHAGLRVLHYEDRKPGSKKSGVWKYEIYMPVLILVSKEVVVRDLKGVVVRDPTTGKIRKERELVLPKDVAPENLFKAGTRLPVWRPSREDSYSLALPITDRVPDVRVELDLNDAIKIGALTTCVIYMLWSEMIRTAPTLALNKRWEEGLPDQVRNRTFNMADGVDKLVPDVGPGLGFIGAHNLAYRYVAMNMTSIMRPNGGVFTTIPEKDQLCNFPDNFSWLFVSATGNGRDRTPYQFSESFPNGRNTCYLNQEPGGRWLLVSPLRNPFRPKTYRMMVVDSRQGLLRLCIEFIWVMGWGDPGAQKDFDAIIQFKKDVIDGFRDLASQISDWQIDYAARRPGVKAEEEKKDVDARYDQTGKDKTWCHREFWLQRLTERYDRISERRENEFRSMAANNTLTITSVDEEWNKGFMWRHLGEEARRAKFLPLYHLAYEVVERVHVMPAFGSETFYRAAAKDLVEKGLYLHLPEDEKAKKKGRLQVMADYCQFVAWAKGSVLNNARATDGHELLKLGVGYYPPGFMNVELVDRFHEIITRFYEHDKIAVDKVLKQITRRLTVSHTGGLGINKDDRSDIHTIILTAIGMGCGVEGLVDELSKLGFELVIDPHDEKMMTAVEFTWRCDRLKELVELEELWRRAGIDVEKEHVSLTRMWLRLIKANDSGILKRLRAATGGKEEASWKAQLFHTSVSAWFTKNYDGIVKEAIQ